MGRHRKRGKERIERKRGGRELGCDIENVILRNKEYFYFMKYINVLTKAQIYKC